MTSRRSRDPATAHTLRELAREAADEMSDCLSKQFVMREACFFSAAVVLADGLEQYGHPRLGRELPSFLRRVRRGEFTNYEATRMWKQIEKDVFRAIQLIKRNKSESAFRTTLVTVDRPWLQRLPKQVNHVSDQEALRLAREAGSRLTYKPGRYIPIKLPNGKLANLFRVTIHPNQILRSKRNWVWAFVPAEWR
jgi:hypothetical protein